MHTVLTSHIRNEGAEQTFQGRTENTGPQSKAKEKEKKRERSFLFIFDTSLCLLLLFLISRDVLSSSF